MKTKIVTLCIFVLTLTSCSLKNQDITGTWKLSEFRRGDMNKMIKLPPNLEQLKLITNTHFKWICHKKDDSTQVVLAGAGGTYTLDGDTTYTESIDYSIKNMEHFKGKKAVFQVKIENDTLHYIGTLDGTIPVEEVWVRIKPAEPAK